MTPSGTPVGHEADEERHRRAGAERRHDAEQGGQHVARRSRACRRACAASAPGVKNERTMPTPKTTTASSIRTFGVSKTKNATADPRWLSPRQAEQSIGDPLAERLEVPVHEPPGRRRRGGRGRAARAGSSRTHRSLHDTCQRRPAVGGGPPAETPSYPSPATSRSYGPGPAALPSRRIPPGDPDPWTQSCSPASSSPSRSASTSSSRPSPSASPGCSVIVEWLRLAARRRGVRPRWARSSASSSRSPSPSASPPGIVMEFQFGTNWAELLAVRRRHLRRAARGRGRLRLLPRVGLPRPLPLRPRPRLEGRALVLDR